MKRWVPIGLLWLLAVSVPVGGVVDDVTSSGGIPSSTSWLVFVLAFVSVGALIVSRRPGHPIGWILLLAGVSSVLVGSTGYAADEFIRLGSDQPVLVIGWISTWAWLPVWLAPTFGLLLFPTGRLPSRRWRPVVWLAIVGFLAQFVTAAFAPGPMQDVPMDNPFGVDVGIDLWNPLRAVGIAALLIAVAASIVSLVVRYRAAHAVERQQIKWLMYAGMLVAGGLCAVVALETVIGPGTAPYTEAIASMALATVPVATGIAILRHRLFDIDVVVNRTLVYGGLTVSLGAAYVGSVLLLQLVLRPLTETSGLAVAVSTLAVAALFRPVRSRIQAVVDRRFFRRKYDAARTLAAFGGRLRDELDVEALGTDLEAVVRDTMQPAHVSLWLRRAER
ncbi:hypothetical protein EV649_4343 [Kribbella sp. VKM Ac-2569]|uniref:hypothetical protein n=1 Tax=Kribbella sp. VKM Ac-2569 TaxID=2512220 RepID=UPI00102AB33B|nr:hypothetical protein [Kribbella sp. VKM Ac-2569]RZT16810.1 hypothetical protein EV649_4343 [Kribbella sp. VKM Ac-2569]